MPPPPPRTRAQPDGDRGLFETETGATYLPRTAVDNAAAAADDRAHAYTTLGRAAITAVAQCCPQLQHLNVCNTGGKVTDASITAVAQGCRVVSS